MQTMRQVHDEVEANISKYAVIRGITYEEARKMAYDNKYSKMLCEIHKVQNKIIDSCPPLSEE